MSLPFGETLRGLRQGGCCVRVTGGGVVNTQQRWWANNAPGVSCMLQAHQHAGEICGLEYMGKSIVSALPITTTAHAHIPGAGQVFSTACDAQTSVNDLANMIMNTLGVDIPINYAPPRPGDVKNALADVSKAKQLLGYDAAVHFREGLERVINWYKNKAN